MPWLLTVLFATLALKQAYYSSPLNVLFYWGLSLDLFTHQHHETDDARRVFWLCHRGSGGHRPPFLFLELKPLFFYAQFTGSIIVTLKGSLACQ